MHPKALLLCGLCGLTPVNSAISISLPVPPQTEKPAWCEHLPRPEYKSLELIPTSDPWFEVYKVVAGVYAIYEPHQSEETIGYLILGSNKALLFDTGMGISDVKKVTRGANQAPDPGFELPHARRSRWRQLAIRYRLGHGHRLHPHQLQRFPRRRAGRNRARRNLRQPPKRF